MFSAHTIIIGLALDAGVTIVTLGGYFLALSSSQPSIKKSDPMDDEGRGLASPSCAEQRADSSEAYGGGLEMIADLTVAGDGGARTSFYGAVVCHSPFPCVGMLASFLSCSFASQQFEEGRGVASSSCAEQRAESSEA